MKEGYIKRKTSTIPFGYEPSEIEGYFKPIPQQIKCNVMMVQIGMIYSK